MKALRQRGFDSLVKERAAAGTPLLGICVGMQMLFELSEEFGTTEGLGLLPGRVRRFETDLVVPQVGWKRIRQKQKKAICAEWWLAEVGVYTGWFREYASSCVGECVR